MHVLIADAFEQSGVDGLTAAGCSITYQPDLKGARATRRCRQHACRCPRRPQYAGHCRHDGRWRSLAHRPGGAGATTRLMSALYTAAWHLCVELPGRMPWRLRNSLSAMLAIDRRMADGVADLHLPSMEQEGLSKAHGLLGSTLAWWVWQHRVGSCEARIGIRTRSRCLEPSTRESRGSADLPVVIANSPEDVARRADIVSVHLALNKGTRGFIGESFLAAMKPGAMFINGARGTRGLRRPRTRFATRNQGGSRRVPR